MNSSITGYGEAEMARMVARVEFPRNHLDSVFVAVIGNLWEPGCEEAVDEMVDHTRIQSDCWMQKFRPWGFPEAEHNGMRDLAVQMAKTQGFEWIYFTDNDVLAPPDTILKLMANRVAIVAPYYTEPGTNKVVGVPQWSPNTGLQRMRWITTSSVLFQTAVFNCGVRFRENPLELMFYLSLWDYAHRPYMDTNTPVQLLLAPTRPGDFEWDDRWAKLESNYGNSKRAGECGSGT